MRYQFKEEKYPINFNEARFYTQRARVMDSEALSYEMERELYFIEHYAPGVLYNRGLMRVVINARELKRRGLLPGLTIPRARGLLRVHTLDTIAGAA